MLAKQKWQIETIKVLESVFEERGRQVARYGHNHECYDGSGPDARWLSGIVAPSAVTIEKLFRADYEAFEEETGAPTWVHLLREEVAEAFAESDPRRLEEELVQLAALCVSWIETLHVRGALPVPEEDDDADVPAAP